jgi:hypothetical protein
MSDVPVKDAFTTFPSSGDGGNTVAVPLIDGGGRVFRDKTIVTLTNTTPMSKIYFMADGSDPTDRSKRYTSPFTIDATSTVKAIAVNDKGERSLTAEAKFYKKPNNWTVKINSRYSSQYDGGGDEGLIDGIRGTVNFASGEWQGYQGQDFVATIDLQKETTVSRVGGGFLQVARSWIWMPTDIDPTDMDPKTRDYVQSIVPTKARFIRVHAYNLGKIPSWHPGAGGDAYIFVDEIIIE